MNDDEDYDDANDGYGDDGHDVSCNRSETTVLHGGSFKGPGPECALRGCPEALACLSKPFSLPLPLQGPLLAEHAVCLQTGTIATAIDTSLPRMLWALF